MWSRYSPNVSSFLLFLVFPGLMFFGCAPRPVEMVSPPQPIPKSDRTRPRVQAEKPIEPNPRVLASLRLSEQARLYLKAHKPDKAIRILERAINLDPNNGQSYYFLAEAWLLKDLVGQAREFNRLARIYLTGADSSWREKVKRQRERIDRAD